MNKIKNRNNLVLILSMLILLSLFFFYWISIPDPLFNEPSCTVIEDRNGELLGAMIADDGQWRFPYRESIPEKYEKTVILFEDRYFYYHFGVNPVSLVRALIQNLKEGRIVSGGSTLSMQVIRLSRKGKKRTIHEKIIEIILATRLEIKFTKKEIISLYASNAPFGGNVVGIDAASWRYFGRPPDELSWAEIAMLTVLPNAPSLIHPGKNRELLMEKRNRLLRKCYYQGIIDSLTCELSLLEPLPEKPLPIPSIAPHLLGRMYLTSKGTRIRTTLDINLQERVTQIIEQHHGILNHNEIHNAACLVLEVETGNVLAYVGNTQNPDQPEYSSNVDVIMSPRSTGSILKPILYCLMLNQGEILPETLVPDIPTHFPGFTPKNFSLTYDGVVTAKKALSRSLNIPAVKMLQDFGLERFYYYLKKLGISTLTYPADHYGLSLILGGAEGCLWDITGIFCSFARILNHYNTTDGNYFPDDIHGPSFIYAGPHATVLDKKQNFLDKNNLLDAGSIWLTFQALVEVNRPETEIGWRMFSSSAKVAWKTGTSFGFRDGWAIGTSVKHTVGVWTGNADGEGRPGLTGMTAAAPILFDVFDLLPSELWFDQPFDELTRIPVCKQSGHRISVYCTDTLLTWIPLAGLNTLPCPYHQLVHLTPDGKFRVTSNCSDVSEMRHESWFVLPPVQEWYFKSKNPGYKPLPPLHKDCLVSENIDLMDLIYPKHAARIYVPFELSGKRGQIVLEAAHRRPEAIIYWHLDNEYIGMTQYIHQMSITPEKGEHTITLVDEAGNVIQNKFEVLDREK